MTVKGDEYAMISLEDLSYSEILTDSDATVLGPHVLAINHYESCRYHVRMSMIAGLEVQRWTFNSGSDGRRRRAMQREPSLPESA
jgi:hypothetical protein